jgi:hypothetical protein
MKFNILAFALVGLSACVTIDANEATANAKPASREVRALLVEAARNTFFDPYSIRDAEISYVGTFPNGNQFVCGRANAKNRFGGYTGRETLAVYLRGTQLIGSGENATLCNNPNLRWQKFSELEAL